jgi:hypothetical protein
MSFPSVVVFFVLCLEGGYPSIYTQRRDGAMAIIPGAKPIHHRHLHGGMQPPREGEARRHQGGSGCPLGVAGPWPLPLATAFAWQAVGWTSFASPGCFTLLELIWWRTCCSFAQLHVENAFPMNFFAYSSLWPVGMWCTKTCGECEYITPSSVILCANFVYFM